MCRLTIRWVDHELTIQRIDLQKAELTRHNERGSVNKQLVDRSVVGLTARVPGWKDIAPHPMQAPNALESDCARRKQYACSGEGAVYSGCSSASTISMSTTTRPG